MKIYCEHCHHDISIECDNHFEQYEVGRVQCPECRKKQKRYISEADILTYFALSECMYIVLVFITMIVYRIFGLSFVSMAVLLALFILAFFCSKQLSRSIYTTGLFKKETMYHIYEEDAESIKKSMKWQFILFFALAITLAAGTDFNLFFEAMLVLSAILSLIKMHLALKREKQNS